MKKKTSEIVAVWIFDLVVNILIIFALVVVIQTWIIAPFDVSGSSMCDSLNVINGQCQTGHGEKIIINKALYLFNEPERGDIIVFKLEADPETSITEDKYFIKRVIGLPGDTVEIEDGKVFVTKKNSEDKIEIQEPYLNETNAGNTEIRYESMRAFIVPENEYFVLGDNRKVSTDSRSCFDTPTSQDCPLNPEKAFVKTESIQGKAWVVWWPLSNLQIINQATYPELEATGTSD